MKYIPHLTLTVIISSSLAAKYDTKNDLGKFPGPPLFTREMPSLITKPAGAYLALKCRAFGNPEPNITWYKNDEPPRRELGDIRKRHFSLILEDLILSDRGNYTCVVCNTHSCINHTTTLDVIQRYPNRPILIRGLENKTVTIGTNVTLSCDFLEDLEPLIQWMKMNRNNSWTHLHVSSATENIYEIRNVTYDDEGWYTCIAANTLGATNSSGYLEVIESLDERNQLAKDLRTSGPTYKGINILYFMLGILSY